MSNNRIQDDWWPDGSFGRAPFVERLLGAPNLGAFVTDLITTQATAVTDTEAAAFLIEGGISGADCKLIVHIRPHQSTQKIRDAAIKAFKDLIKPCVAEGKDGAIELTNPGEVHNSDSQYCLVTLLRTEGKAVAASAVISRCRDLNQAKMRLQSMQLLAGYFEVFSLRNKEMETRSGPVSGEQVGRPVTNGAYMKQVALGLVILLIVVAFVHLFIHRPM